MTQSAVTTYSVEYYPEGQDSSSVTLTVNAPTTTVMIVGLSKGTRYTVQVYANNAIGSSSLSNLLTARTDIDRKLHTLVYKYVLYCIAVLEMYMYVVSDRR